MFWAVAGILTPASWKG